MANLRKLAVASALLALVAAAAFAQQPQTPLPDVNVTAPAPIQQVNPFKPYTTDTRVDETKWPVIPCGIARVDLGPGSKCQTGTPVETFLEQGLGTSRCDIARQLASIQNARYQIEADIMVFDPYKVVASTPTGHQGKNCFVWSGYTNMPDDFHDMNQMTRRATAWGALAKGDPQSTVAFTDAGRSCMAVERLGPPWHGGYVWVVHFSVCPATPATLQTADIDAVFTMLKITVFDPKGNLRAPGPQQ